MLALGEFFFGVACSKLSVSLGEYLDRKDALDVEPFEPLRVTLTVLTDAVDSESRMRLDCVEF